MSEHLEFITFNGFTNRVEESVTMILHLLSIEDTFRACEERVPDFYKKIVLQIQEEIVSLHDYFSRITSLPRAGKKSNKFYIYDHREYARQNLKFILGVAYDPYLYSNKTEFQQSAVLNLHKAREILGHMLSYSD